MRAAEGNRTHVLEADACELKKASIAGRLRGGGLDVGG